MIAAPGGASAVRIYFDARPVDVEPGSTPLVALQRHDPVAAGLVQEGARVLVDNRGLPAPLDEPVSNGSIFRVVGAKQARP